MEYIQDDELLEVTPKSIRIRKKALSAHDSCDWSDQGVELEEIQRFGNISVCEIVN